MTPKRTIEEIRLAMHGELHAIQVSLKNPYIDPNLINLHGLVDLLASRAEEEAKRAEAAELTLVAVTMSRDQWRADAVRLEREVEKAETRIANEQAARRLAQEYGIGDRARIEELEREVERLRKAQHVRCFWCHVADGCFEHHRDLLVPNHTHPYVHPACGAALREGDQ